MPETQQNTSAVFRYPPAWLNIYRDRIWPFLRNRGPGAALYISGPVMIAAVIMAALLSPLPFQWSSPENGFFNMVLMLGLAAAVSSVPEYFYRRGAGKWVCLAMLAAAPALGAPAARFLFIPAGELLRGEHHLFLTGFSLTAFCAALLFYAIRLWASREQKYRNRLAVPLAVVSAGLAAAVLVAAADGRREAVRGYAPGYRVEQLYRVDVSPDSSLIAAGERLYIIDARTVRALDAADGTELWTLESGSLLENSEESLGGTVLGDRLLVFREGWLKTAGESFTAGWLIEPETGEVTGMLNAPARELLEAEEVFIGEQISGGGLLYYMVVEAAEPYTVALRAVDIRGKIIWERFSERPFSDLTYADGFLLGRMEVDLWCMDADSGLLEWSFSGGIAVSSYTAAGKQITLGGNTLTSLDEAGEINWEWSPPEKVFVTGLAAEDELIIAALSNGSVVSLRADDGSEAWKQPLERPLHKPSLFSTGEGRLWAGSSRGALYYMDAATGEPLWRYRGRTFAPLRALEQAGDRVYYLAGGYLYALAWEGGER